MAPRRSIPPPSPARSTRSARSNRGDDDWDGESMTSNSFKVPNSRNSKNGNTSLSLSLKDTSVNIAAAFHAAQTGQHLPIPNEQSFQSFTSSSHRATSSGTSQKRAGSQRARSPAEQLASAARALSPVRFFLRSTEEENETGDLDNSGGFTSFSSLGNGNGSGIGNHSGESYDYAQEDEFVRQAQAQSQALKTKTKPRLSDSKRRKGKAFAEDLPYRPTEDDEIYESDSGGDGEGIVRGGALDGRADTRGKRQEKGQGYLGMGLGIQPRHRKTGKQLGDGDYAEGSEGEQQEEEEQEEQEVYENRSQRALTPAIDYSNGYRRSPTPMQVLNRALSPRLDNRKSPAPTFHPRRRRPSSLRTIITNLLHGMVMGLQFVVELITNLLRSLLLRPSKTMFGSGKGFLRHIKQDWWKYLGAILALNLALRALDAPWRSKGEYRAPRSPPGSIDEIAARLTSLEQVTDDISELLKSLSNGESDNRQSSHITLGRMDDLENALMVETRRVEALRGDGDKGVKSLQHSFDSLRAEVKGLVDRVGSSESAIALTEGKFKSMDNVDQEVQQLKTRVGEVEKKVTDALDDGRLRTALEKILPDALPIKVNSRGTVDIDPRFWSEMKKVMMSRTDTEALVKQAISSTGSAKTEKVVGKVEMDEGKVRAWAEEVFDKRSSSSEFLSKDMFQNILHSELQSLRSEVSSIRFSAAASSPSTVPPAKPSVTIKTSKGDDLTSLFNDLIDAALLKYSKDTLARTDYALFTAGARVIPQLTSDTLVLSTASKVGKLVMGSKDVQGRPPATALHPDISVGSCWPFKGDQGSLGVMLTRRIKVTDLTIEHAPKELALDMSTAPKVIQVMGVVDTEEDKARLNEYWADRNESGTSPDHLPLGTITYDPHSISHIQTFPVPDDIVSLDIKVGVVILKVDSNWGGGFTCLYRVRVHGDSEDDL
ncbi:uncharacterized protein IL334_004171 [Kwoniella shivajii]|uniref:SUN domain-containing protein n=1 Tax=Kwoniella shivajii TaxID=564305 RepID=A0ABZ1D1C4_9TREE|nr:hypothetical protein IL334_004171 [Kwoniella shivajii]